MDTNYSHQLAVSPEEIAALVKYHTNQVRRVTKAYGKAALELQAGSVLPCGRKLKMLHEFAKAEADKRLARAKWLASLIT